ncbi:MAG: multiple resistance and pH regulation protein F [Deltaproteobacteria bacterium]|nr:multiple resistance and pH regulation protein F [Deltaproteobacteria bacterium]
MTDVFLTGAFGLLLTMIAGALVVLRRREGPDAILAVLLLGTTGVGLSLLLGAALFEPSALDLALVLAVLAPVIGISFLRIQGYGK